METAPVPLTKIAEELNTFGLACRIIGPTVTIRIGERSELVVSDVYSDTLDGSEPHLNISHHLWESPDYRNHIYVSLAHVSAQLAARYIKETWEYFTDEEGSAFDSVGSAQTRRRREHALFSQILDARMRRHGKSPQEISYERGQIEAYVMLTGVDPETLNEELDEAAQAIHDEMIVSQEAEF